MHLNLKAVSDASLFDLIDSLHEDVENGIPGSFVALNAAQAEVRRRTAIDFSRVPKEHLFLRSERLTRWRYQRFGVLPPFLISWEKCGWWRDP